MEELSKRVRRITLQESELGLSEGKEEIRAVTLKNNGGVPIHLTVRTQYDVPLDEKYRKSRSNGFTISRSYETMAGDSLEFRLKLEVTGSKIDNSSIVEKKKTVRIDPEKEDVGENTYYDLELLSLEPDDIKFQFVISDSDGDKSGYVNTTFQVKEFNSEVSVSDIVFIKHIQRSKEQSPFTRQGVLMVPNPARVFSSSKVRGA